MKNKQYNSKYHKNNRNHIIQKYFKLNANMILYIEILQYTDKAMLGGKFRPKCTNQKLRKIEIQSNFPS